MITRRTILRAAVVQGVVGGFAAALAQAQAPSTPPSTSKPKTAPKPRATANHKSVRSNARIERALAPVRDEHHLPGLIGAILMDHRPVVIGAVGDRKVGERGPFLVSDQVHLGSCTKAMTATMIGLLVDEGKLSWGSTVRDVFPDVASQLDTGFQPVTLLQLLTHRAGLPADGPWWFLKGKGPTEQRRSLLTTMMKGPPKTKPGSTYAYSNVGYALAGLMAEQAAGQSWESLMRHKLFEPLEMAGAGFGPPGRPGKIDQPWGHHVSADGKVTPTRQDNPAALGPAGTVHCTISDWARFAAFHLAGARRRGQAKLLKPGTFKILQVPPAGFEYAGGWMVVNRPWAGGRALTHGGSNTAWYATIWIAPARNFALFAATNQGGKAAATANEQAIRALIQVRKSLA